MHKADWDLFQYKLDTQIHVTDLQGYNVEQLEQTIINWTKVVKNAMHIAISKGNYKFIYQLKTTPGIRNLASQFKTPKEFATHFGWTMLSYREYLRIKAELREICKDVYNKNWEDRINNIPENSNNSKQFCNKIKLLKGKNTNHVNYMKGKEGNKFSLKKRNAV